MDKASVRDIEVKGKRVFVRVDFNVPMDEKSATITDDVRIRAALPTINYLVERGARVILASHLGRPDGKVVESMRMAPVAKRLSELAGRPVVATADCAGPDAEQATRRLKDGDILLLENVRFHAEEEANGTAFAEALSRLADIYVDDAFGTAHRKHASIVGVAKYLPAVSGLLMERELEMLGGLLSNPGRPFCALLGGAKISDKVGLLRSIMGKIDRVLIGGGMAATFLKAKGLEVGMSLIEADRIQTALDIAKEAEARNVAIMLPKDVLVSDKTTADGVSRVVPAYEIPEDLRIVDIGPESIKAFKDQLKDCKTVFWNGPMGIYEVPKYSTGTKEMANALAGLKANTVIGGGSTSDIVAELGLESKMTFVSTGGGASLSFLSGEKLPGVEVLMDKSQASKLK